MNLEDIIDNLDNDAPNMKPGSGGVGSSNLGLTYLADTIKACIKALIATAFEIR